MSRVLGPLNPRKTNDFIKAFGIVNGTLGTPGIGSKSYNLASVVDNGTGDYTVSFTKPLNETAYSVLLTAARSGSDKLNMQVDNATTATQFRVYCTDDTGTAQDTIFYALIVSTQ